MIKSYERGHEIYYDTNNSVWRYMDNNQFLHEIERACIHCLQLPINGFDACLGELPNVKHACCGHGIGKGFIITNKGYEWALSKRK